MGCTTGRRSLDAYSHDRVLTLKASQPHPAQSVRAEVGRASHSPFCCSPSSAAPADKLADWAVSACRELSNLTYPGAAKALLGLALRGRSAAAAPPPGPAPMGAAAPKRETGCGDDLDLLVDLAADVRQMMNADGAGRGCSACSACAGCSMHAHRLALSARGCPMTQPQRSSTAPGSWRASSLLLPPGNTAMQDASTRYSLPSPFS